MVFYRVHRENPTQKYCATGCYHRNRPTQKTGRMVACVICGKAFYVIASRDMACCSVKCGNAWQARNKHTFDCAVCGCKCTVSPSNASRRCCSRLCSKKDPVWIANSRRGIEARRRDLATSLEVHGYELLDTLGVPYEKQKSIGPFSVDAFVAGRLVVQLDGDYWHGHPVRFPSPNPVQRRSIRRDRAHDAYMKVCGFPVLRAWESDVHSAPAEFLERVRLALQTHLK